MAIVIKVRYINLNPFYFDQEALIRHMAISFVAVIITVSANQCQVFLWMIRIEGLVQMDLHFALLTPKDYNVRMIQRRFEKMFVTC